MHRDTHPLDEMQALTRRLREALEVQRLRPTVRVAAWQPPMDLQATDDAYVLRLDLPGARREDVQAIAEEGALLVRGEVRLPEALAEARPIRSERSLGRFARSVRLPSDADLSDITAALADGVLRIRVGRRAQAGRINIEIGEH